MVNIKIPRQAIYRSFTDDPGTCPRCGKTLVNERQTYMVATRRGKKITDSFIMRDDFGWFCKSCPIVVLNEKEIYKMFSVGAKKWGNVGQEYVVLGIVDLDAIPADKRNLPLGGEDNPVPLIEFEDVYETPKILPQPASVVRKKVDGTESQPPTHRSKRRRKRSGSKNSAGALNQ